MSKREKKQRIRKLRGQYGVDAPEEVASLIMYGVVTAGSGIILFLCFGPLVKGMTFALPFIPRQTWSFLVGFGVGIIALLSLAFWLTLVATLHTSLSLRFRMARRIAELVSDWSQVEAVLDVGCGRGILLNTMALRLQKEKGKGQVVGVDLWSAEELGLGTMAGTLKAAAFEGVEQLVTCKTGDCVDLPFADAFFDVVVSALCIHNVAQGPNANHPAAVAERNEALKEMIRVTKPGGQIIIWDLLHAPQYVKFFESEGMEDIYISKSVSAFLLASHIVAVTKPKLKPRSAGE